ncbi:esterase/lipase family protein [Altererythrobacter sp. MF3-039]|uniref:esterase/lipase family protein n=1 Tax=Altererythrobacter sp. MF3-039 TaxID=3252901 RepID=UPI00390CCEC1
MIRERVRLASQKHDGTSVPPSRARFLGEASYAFSPLAIRLGRRPEVAPSDRQRSVLILPGFLAHPVLTRYLGQQVARAGHRTAQWQLGVNFGPSEARMAGMERQVLELQELHCEPVVLLGWSLGGIYAREIAKRQPEAVAKVITMGSPFSGNRRSNNAWRLYQFVTGHSVDAPPIEAELHVKPPVPTTAIWSPRDGIVSPRSACGRPGERDRAIALRCTHMGFSYAPESINAVLSELESD